MEISPSMLASDFAKLSDELKKIEENGADYVHLDVMDGMFVPNITFGAPVIKSMRKYSGLPFDVHLMIKEPSRYIDDFVKAGADIITFHVEAESDMEGTIQKIKDSGVKCGLSIKPGTPVDELYPFINKIDLALIMTVEPGFGGQKFMPEMLKKVRFLKDKIKKTGAAVKIEVDGGIDEETAKIAGASGVDICVAGTSVFNASDIKARINAIKSYGSQRT